MDLSLSFFMGGSVGVGVTSLFKIHSQSACSVWRRMNFHRRLVIIAISLKPCLRNRVVSHGLVKWLWRAVRLYACKGKWTKVGQTWAEEREGKRQLRVESTEGRKRTPQNRSLLLLVTERHHYTPTPQLFIFKSLSSFFWIPKSRMI